MLLLATMLTFTACGGDNDDEPQNSLNGTTWTSSYVDEVFVIEFNGKNGVTGFVADNNLNIKGDAYHGSYTRNGDNLTFNNFYIMNFYKFVFKKATINGSTMTVDYEYKVSDKVFEDTRTFRKR